MRVRYAWIVAAGACHRQLAAVYIGKESDRYWEEGEDWSLLEFNTIVYKRKGFAVATAEQLARIADVPKREFMRRRINQHTLEQNPQS